MMRVYHREKQSDLADSLKLSKSYLSEIESERKVPTVDVLNRYAEHFSMPVSSLIFVAESLSTQDPKGKAKIVRKAMELLKWVENTTDV